MIGETHQGLFDLAFLRTIPNFVIMAPKDFNELGKMLEFGINLEKPVAIRYPRGGESSIKFEKCNSIELGKAEIIQKGNDITIVAIGKMVSRAVDVAEKLQEKNISAEVINARFLKPLDKKMILESAMKTRKVITIEDGIINGGLGTAVIEAINNSDLEDVKVKTFGYKDCFVKHGSVEELEEENEISTEKIVLNVDFTNKKKYGIINNVGC